MPRTGYWVECIPLSKRTGGSDGLVGEKVSSSTSDSNALQDLNIKVAQENKQDLYSASIPSIPEASAFANSPDAAIDKLKLKLKSLKKNYENLQRPMPRPHNPIRPPKRLRDIPGWLSIYIEFDSTEPRKPTRH